MAAGETHEEMAAPGVQTFSLIGKKDLGEVALGHEFDL
jgi:hypothetical protein